ncbi:hypothetical protein PAEPH01_1027 [Pancytospora epiphaga]|nr:hypothetical protein PAEPH01_1027 [Pancytospora epiphaga]
MTPTILKQNGLKQAGYKNLIQTSIMDEEKQTGPINKPCNNNLNKITSDEITGNTRNIASYGEDIIQHLTNSISNTENRHIEVDCDNTTTNNYFTNNGNNGNVENKNKFGFEDLFEDFTERLEAECLKGNLKDQQPFNYRDWDSDAKSTSTTTYKDFFKDRINNESGSDSMDRLNRVLELHGNNNSLELTMKRNNNNISNSYNSDNSSLETLYDPVETNDKKKLKSYNEEIEKMNMNESKYIDFKKTGNSLSGNASNELYSSSPVKEIQNRQSESELESYHQFTRELLYKQYANCEDSARDADHRKKKQVEDRLFSLGKYGIGDIYPKQAHFNWNKGNNTLPEHMRDNMMYNQEFDTKMGDNPSSYQFHGQNKPSWIQGTPPGIAYNSNSFETEQTGEINNRHDQMSHLYRQPFERGSLGSFYGFRKKRRNNPSLWNVSNPKREVGKAIPPSKYSSLEFIQGMVNRKAFMGTSPRIPEKTRNNFMFPSILELEEPLNSEQSCIVRSFKEEVTQLDLENITVFQLKALMKEYGLNHSGKKGELIEIVKEAYTKACGLAHLQSSFKNEKPEKSVSRELDYDKYFF